MRTIHKFTLPTYPCTHHQPAKGFLRWLSVGRQEGQLVAWAEVDTDGGVRYADALIAWTGQPFPSDNPDAWTPLGTVQVGALVCHVYQPYQPKG